MRDRLRAVECPADIHEKPKSVADLKDDLGPTLTEALDVYLRLKGKDKGITFWKDQTGPRN
jgi:hypothetical protein